MRNYTVHFSLTEIPQESLHSIFPQLLYKGGNVINSGLCTEEKNKLTPVVIELRISCVLWCFRNIDNLVCVIRFIFDFTFVRVPTDFWIFFSLAKILLYIRNDQ